MLKKTGDASPIANEGYPFIGIAFLLVLIGWWIHPLLLVLFFGLFLFVVSFFRNPRRTPPTGDNLVVSPADGKIIFLGEVDEGRILKRRLKKVSVFMSPLNVHVNRAPVNGVIKKVEYTQGKFFGAFSDKASLDNEQNALVIESKKGDEILFIQIAGFLARRIVNYVRPGDHLNVAEIFGLIRFGSRMDIYFPLTYQFRVKVGDRVKAGESILSILSEDLL